MCNYWLFNLGKCEIIGHEFVDIEILNMNLKSRIINLSLGSFRFQHI